MTAILTLADRSDREAHGHPAPPARTITVTLDPHHSPRVNRALACLTDELNTTPAHMPGDPRPITYQLAA